MGELNFGGGIKVWLGGIYWGEFFQVGGNEQIFGWGTPPHPPVGKTLLSHTQTCLDLLQLPAVVLARLKPLQNKRSINFLGHTFFPTIWYTKFQIID